MALGELSLFWRWDRIFGSRLVSEIYRRVISCHLFWTLTTISIEPGHEEAWQLCD